MIIKKLYMVTDEPRLLKRTTEKIAKPIIKEREIINFFMIILGFPFLSFTSLLKFPARKLAN